MVIILIGLIFFNKKIGILYKIYHFVNILTKLGDCRINDYEISNLNNHQWPNLL